MGLLCRRSRLIVASALLAAAMCGPAYPQKVLAEGIKDLANQIATNVSKEKKQNIAILPFRELDGKPTILGAYISEELITDLFVIGGIDIVERTMLDRLIAELKLGQTGIIDRETAKRVGKVAGASAIVTGSITDLQSYVALNCRLIDAQTGRVFAAAQTKIIKDDDVRKIMEPALSAPIAGTSQAPSSKFAPQQQRVGNVVFDLKSCSLAGNLVTCEFLVTNSGEDDYVALYCEDSRLVDSEGNEHHAEVAMIGSSKINRMYPKTWSNLASGIPVRAQLSFDGVANDRATLIELRVDVQKKEHVVQFRNVSLVRP